MAVHSFEVYSGKDPYIFVSYSHKDNDIVVPIIRYLQELSFRVWYDAGIEAGTEWPEYIAEYLYNSDCVLCFISKNSLDSHNCRREINFAIDNRKQMLIVYLEEVELSLGMQMQLNTIQAMYKYRHGNNKSFIKSLTDSRLLSSCREHVSTSFDGSEINIKDDEPVSEINQSTKPEPGTDTQEKNEDERIKEISDFYRRLSSSVPPPRITSSREKTETEKQFEEYKVLAEQGDANAQYELARCYHLGIGTEFNSDKEYEYYKKAADQGHADAAFIMGQRYRIGIKTKKDPKLAFSYFLIAAKQGDAKAQYFIAESYRYARGVRLNRKKAIEWYKKAAEQGHTLAKEALKKMGIVI